MNGLADFVRAFGAARIAAMAAVTALMIGFFAFIIIRWSSPHMVPLFTELAIRDSNQIVRELDRAGTKYDIKNDGTAIMVPDTEVARLRMRLAEQGLPTGSGVGYEIFDKSEALGTTSFVQNINHLRAMEGELSRSIAEIDRVQSARVHLVMPERQIFARDAQEPTASIILKLRGSLEGTQVKAIQHLVASAVPGMKPTSVSIIDEGGRLLASGRSDDMTMLSSTMDEKIIANESRLRSEIEDIVSRIVGPGRARVRVSTELDWNRVTQTQDTFDPEGRVVRSTQTHEEKNQSQQPGEGKQVSVGNEVPRGNANAAANAAASEGGNRENGEKTDETVNYEISRTSRTEVLEAGRIKKISVAVLVDGLYEKEGDKVAYKPRPQEELDRIASLVRSAIGFDEKRGDKVEIVNLQFAEGPKAPEAAPEASSFLPKFTLDDYFRMAELAIIFILGTLMVLFGVRPLLRSVLAPASEQPPARPQQAASASHHAPAAGHAPPAHPAPASAPPPAQQPAASKAPPPQVENATTKALEYAMAVGGAHKESVERVGDLVRGNPKEAVAVVRTWLGERAA